MNARKILPFALVAVILLLFGCIQQPSGQAVSASPPSIEDIEQFETFLKIYFNPPSDVSQIEGYNIYRSNVSGSYSSTPINSSPIPATETVYHDTTVSTGTVYYYTMKSINAAEQESVASNEKTGIPVPTPTSLSAIAGNNSVSLSWTAPPSIPDWTVIHYRIYRWENSAVQEIGTSTSTTYPDSTALNGHTYTYGVRAEYSSLDPGIYTGTTLSSFQDNASNFPTAMPVSSGTAPSNLTASVSNYSTINLTWYPASPPTTYTLLTYVIYRSTNSGSFSQIDTTANLSYPDQSLSPASYSYYVTAVFQGSSPSDTIESPASNTASAVAGLYPPADISLAAGDSVVNISWSAPQGITPSAYSIYRSTVSGTKGSKIYTGSSNVFFYADISASNNTTYYYTVSSEYGNSSADSSQYSATPSAVKNVTASNSNVAETSAQITASSNNFTGYHLLGYKKSSNSSYNIVYKISSPTVPYTNSATSASYGLSNLSSGTAYDYIAVACDETIYDFFDSCELDAELALNNSQTFSGLYKSTKKSFTTVSVQLGEPNCAISSPSSASIAESGSVSVTVSYSDFSSTPSQVNASCGNGASVSASSCTAPDAFGKGTCSFTCTPYTQGNYTISSVGIPYQSEPVGVQAVCSGSIPVTVKAQKDALCENSAVDTFLVAGKQETIDVSLKNTGIDSWNSSYSLDVNLFGTRQIAIPSGETIASNASKTFSFTATPETYSNYPQTMQGKWQMLYNAENFGEECIVNFSVNTPYPKPENFAATPSNAKVSLYWNIPSAEKIGSSDLNNFIIERKTTGNFSAIKTLSSSLNSYSDENLSNGTKYTYRMRAKYLDGEFSEYTADLNATPSEAEFLDAQCNAESIKSSWTAGESASISVTLKNTGNIEWSSSENIAVKIEGFSSTKTVSLNEDISPGSSKQFSTTATAPSSGTKTIEWYMTRNNAKFGETCTDTITVSSSPPSSEVECTTDSDCFNDEFCNSSNKCELLECSTGFTASNHECVAECSGTTCGGTCYTEAGACCSGEWNPGFSQSQCSTIEEIAELEELLDQEPYDIAQDYLDDALTYLAQGRLQDAKEKAQQGIDAWNSRQGFALNPLLIIGILIVIVIAVVGVVAYAKSRGTKPELVQETREEPFNKPEKKSDEQRLKEMFKAKNKKEKEEKAKKEKKKKEEPETEIEKIKRELKESLEEEGDTGGFK